MKFAARSKEHLRKARDSALLAIEFYNKPAVSFKTGGYITMMAIASTSLFHAIFFKKKIKPFYKNKDGSFDIRDDDFRYWELKTCLKAYYGDTNDAVRANFEFFIPLRNKIEHRSMPQIDATVFAECQSLLLNFDDLIEREFGADFALKESLSFSLQLFPRKNGFDIAYPKPNEKDVVDFILNYRSSLDGSIYSDSRFAFKAFLIKVGNNQAKDSVPIQVVDYDSLSEDQKSEFSKFALMTKTKEVSIANLDRFKPGYVVKKVQHGIGNLKVKRVINPKTGKCTIENRFNLTTHTLFWKKYKVRPENGSAQPSKTKQEYCVYDGMHGDYGFTQKWIDFLIEKAKDDLEYKSLFKNLNGLELLH